MSTPRQLRSRRRMHRASHALPLRHGHDLFSRRTRVPTTRCLYGKRRYFTRLDAELVLACLDRRDPARRETRCYKCPACHGWHLTSQTLEQYAAEHSAPEPASGSARPPTTLDLPYPRGPVPTPAEVADRLGLLRTVPVAPQQNSAPNGLRTLLRRAWRHVTHTLHRPSTTTEELR
ncbi:hypothetical protein [Nocardia mangyaensis]|nr:hypothetical protein [Nocardia mangyaensis]